MPSLRKRVSTYFRQLSFYNEPGRDKKHNVNENSFVTKYLEGLIGVKEGPPILYGKNPTDLPNYDLGVYGMGAATIVGCYSGPNGGLTTVKRLEKHLSVPDTDIDFIDTQDEVEEVEASLSRSPQHQAVDNTTMVIKVAGHEYLVTNRTKQETKSHSLGSLSGDIEVAIEKTKICANHNENNNVEDVKCRNRKDGERIVKRTVQTRRITSDGTGESSKNYNVTKSKSEGNSYQRKKSGKIIRITSRAGTTTHVENATSTLDVNLPEQWNRKSAHVYGISDSLYDRNQVTKHKNGDPIADCFGIIARNDSAILAVADGVNWGEKACIAAKSAVHGCLHYLDKTIFNDTKPFDDLTTQTFTQELPSTTVVNHTRVGNTREIFVCLLRAFNCAHDLILENDGMLTTLTVAVVLPLNSQNVKGSLKDARHRQIGLNSEDTTDSYICCVCNVGDTLAYVYSPKYGVRELTKGSHDVNCNRDMRDALGALGPVDGINPELSNLTLSITVVQKGDIILVASDGLTDNFDPNVCKFTVNSKDARPKRPMTSAERQKRDDKSTTIPVKPPRRNKETTDNSRNVESNQPDEVTAKSSSIGNNKRRSESVDPNRKKSTSATDIDLENPLIAQFVRENSLTESTNVEKSSGRPSSSVSKTPPAPKQRLANQANTGSFLRSKTSIEMRTSAKTILRNEDGVPFVTPLQRYEISLLLMEDVLRHGISGHDSRCVGAQQLCENLVNFTFSITAAKRHTLEDTELYFDNVDGVLVEVSQQEKKMRRRKGLERVQNLPGKLDHVSVVAYNVGNFGWAQ